MFPEENKAVVRRPIGELHAPDYVPRDALASGDARGPEADRRVAAAYRGAYPHFDVAAEDEVAEGDRVVTRCVARGTHEGGLPGVPSAGDRFEVSGEMRPQPSARSVVVSRCNRAHLGFNYGVGSTTREGGIG